MLEDEVMFSGMSFQVELGCSKSFVGQFGIPHNLLPCNLRIMLAQVLRINSVGLEVKLQLLQQELHSRGLQFLLLLLEPEGLNRDSCLASTSRACWAGRIQEKLDA